MFYKLGLAVIITGVIGGLIISNYGSGEATELLSDDGPRLVALIAMLIVIGGSFLAEPSGWLRGIKDLLIWGGIGVVLILGYSFRHDFEYLKNRFLAEFNPEAGYTTRTGALAVPIGEDGHFHVRATINGAGIPLLVDSGASRLTLSAQDALTAGFNVEDLHYTKAVSTANGRAMVALVKVDYITIGSTTLNNVEAMVSKPGMLESSLLGMNVLERFGNWRVERGTLYIGE
ncbi:retropepsin-like aspartic protease family protein [Polycladidibacter stylochi]|uniref:retropepsin-like aspartic protease family protein n=1 Tax=Polycladidibacter stylochi TaxID=1807766 RepID=UPI00082AD2A7|nr:TIGR02281 family clan AA aspartic protease [Pseudovibrio stylochi]